MVPRNSVASLFRRSSRESACFVLWITTSSPSYLVFRRLSSEGFRFILVHSSLWRVPRVFILNGLLDSLGSQMCTPFPTPPPLYLPSCLPRKGINASIARLFSSFFCCVQLTLSRIHSSTRQTAKKRRSTIKFTPNFWGSSPEEVHTSPQNWRQQK